MSMTLISEQVLASAAASVTFSSIPQTYTDLVLEVTYLNTTAASHLWFTLNGDSGTNYSRTRIYGDGTTAVSDRTSNVSYIDGIYADTTNRAVASVAIQSYANTATYKTALFRQSNSASAAATFVGLWRSTAAVTSVTFTAGSSQIAAGSTFRLYGVR